MRHLVFVLLALGCSDPSPEARALDDVKQFITNNLNDLYDASLQLQAAAPAPDADGWNAGADAAAVNNMKSAWKRARKAYEHIEGALAVLFPDLDQSTDQRYDAFISIEPDDNLFDDQGVTGVHGIERILWSDSIPSRVVTFEAGLPGYLAAAFPKNQTEAGDFKNKLCARLIADIQTMRDQFGPLALDPAAAYRGVIGSMNEQVEKANKAATGEEESRYAQYTLEDMRANVAAGTTTYAAFRAWLLDKKGSELDGKINQGFQRVQSAYDQLSGDALPPVPSTWSSENPSDADLATPFGQLWQVLRVETDRDNTASLVSVMTSSADLMGIAALP